jgi:hypothetical protein
MGKNQPGKLIALVWIAYRDSFVLKGALLFELWTKDRHRPTRDVDFLAYGPNDLERFIGIFREICSNVFAEDGLTFDVEAINGERIKEDADYEGIRLHFIAYLGNIRYLSRLTLASAISSRPHRFRLNTPRR